MIGVQFGNYTTLSLLGEGGMGAVYLAEHPTIGRRVAIKVLRPEFAKDQLALGRFVNEARAANAIRHPNIIEILDSGNTADGLPYLVMELLEGESLRTRLRRVQRLTPIEALDVAYLTASALAAAHARGILHRDLKPDNLFLVPDPNDDQLSIVKVLDFGIAKLQRESGSLDSLQTQTGTVVGTPSYMSPEQCLGTKTLDGRTDMYSLGVILFEMLCGRTPFQSLGFGELVHLHLNVAPPRPRALVAEVPESIEEIILRALAKQPEDRFSSMEELMDSLEVASNGWLNEYRKSARRHLTAKLGTPSGSRTLKAPLPEPEGARGRFWMLTLGVVGLAILLVAGRVWYGRQTDAGPVATNPTPERKPDGKTPSKTDGKPGKTPGAGKSQTSPFADATPPVVAAIPTVTLRIDSRPRGADVIRVSDGASLGTTPLSQPVAGDGSRLELRVEKDGYVSALRTVVLNKDRSETIELKAYKVVKPKGSGKKPPPEEPDEYEPSKL